MIFWKKRWQSGALRRPGSVFSSKTPIFWHITEVGFDRKYIKIIDILTFIMENRTRLPFFCEPTQHSKKNKVKMSIGVNFRIKVTKKWHARKPIGWNSSTITLTEKWKISLDALYFQKSCIQISCTFIKKWTSKVR